MKSFFIMIVGILIISMMNCIILSIKKNNRFSNPVVNVILASISAMIFYTVHLVTYEETQSYLMKGFYYANLDWILFFMIRYVYVYTDMNLKSVKVRIMSFAVLLLAALDTILLAFNAFFRYYFIMEPIYDTMGELYCWKTIYLTPYCLHIVFCYFMIIYVCFLLGSKAWEVSRIYRRKYLIILVVFSLICFMNALRMVFAWVLDISIFFYAIMVMVISYLTFLFIPREIEASFHYMVEEHINGGVVCFDLNGTCMYISKVAKKIFEDTDEGKKKAEIYRTKWVTHDTDWQAWEDRFIFDDMEHIFAIEYSCLRDKNGKVEGSYLKFQDHTAEVLKLEEEKYKASHDPLTGLYNRVAFFEKAEEIIRNKPNVERYIVATNVKDFKLINDLFGIDFGDRIIKEQAKMLQYADYEDCIKGRISADKFAMLINKKDYKPHLADRNTEAVQKVTWQVNYRMHMHVGIYEIKNSWEKVQTMYDKANMAIDSISADYEKHLVYYDTDMMEQAFMEKYVVGELPKAIEQNRFEPRLVPQYDRNSHVYSMNMQLDWNHSVLGKITSEQYMPILEKAGYSFIFDYYLWRQALKQMHEWKLAGKNLHLSVNISPKSFFYEDVYEKLRELISEYDIEPGMVFLEITEVAFRNDTKILIESLEKLHNFGFNVVIDNFGSGFSSLNLLKDVEVDILKLDKEFLRESENEERSRIILKMIVTMAGKLGIKVVADGVDTEKQMKYLVELGCAGFQGAYFSGNDI